MLEWSALTVRASALGLTFDHLEEWLESNVNIASIKLSNDESVKIGSDPSLRAISENKFEEVYRNNFSETYYRAEPFIVTRFKTGILFRQGVFIVKSGDTNYCIAETLGDSSQVAVEFTNQFQELKKEPFNLTIVARMLTLPKPEQQKTSTITIILSNINNYGHWHVHNIPILDWVSVHARSILKATKNTRIRIILPHVKDNLGGGLKKFYIDRIAKEVPVEIIDPDDIEKPLLIENVIISSTYNLDSGPNWPVMFSSLFENARYKPKENTPERIYCNRSHAGHRGIVNETELENGLVGLGFTVLYPGKMSYDEQREAFANAAVIVGSHGGALTNMVYSTKKPIIIELSHPFYGPIQYRWFRNLAAVMGFRHAAIVCDVPEEYKGKSYRDTFFRVEVKALLSRLSPLIQSISLG